MTAWKAFIRMPIINTGKETPVVDADTGTALMPSRSGVAPARADPHPVAVYLAGLTEGPGRTAMRSTFRRVADVLGSENIETTPWHELRF